MSEVSEVSEVSRCRTLTRLTATDTSHRIDCLNWSYACQSVSRQCRSGVGVCRLKLVSEVSIVSKCQLTLVSKCRAGAQSPAWLVTKYEYSLVVTLVS